MSICPGRNRQDLYVQEQSKLACGDTPYLRGVLPRALFLQMAVKYGKKLQTPPGTLPSG